MIGIDGSQTLRSGQTLPGNGWLPTPASSEAVDAQSVATGDMARVHAGGPPGVPVGVSGISATDSGEAGHGMITDLSYINQVHQQLDAAGRTAQPVLPGNGAFGTVGTWRVVPEWVMLIVRTARNCRLNPLPTPTGRGRPCRYGDPESQPQAWLTQAKMFREKRIIMRGRTITLRSLVSDPFMHERLPGRPHCLVVVEGTTWPRGQQRSICGRRKPTWYMVNAVATVEGRHLPLLVADLTRDWQR